VAAKNEVLAVRVKGKAIIGERVFDAPRELVWQAWSDPDIITLWWGPRGFSTTTETMEMKPDGIWKFIMHGPDGHDYQNKVIYIEVRKPELLVYRHAGEDENEEPVRFHVTVNFDKHGRKTKLSMRMEFETIEELKKVEADYRAIEGLEHTLERLGEYLLKNQKF